MARKVWMFDPDGGGVKIPETVKADVRKRLEAYAADHFAGRSTRLDVRFRGQFCYVDAFTEPDPRDLSSAPSRATTRTAPSSRSDSTVSSGPDDGAIIAAECQVASTRQSGVDVGSGAVRASSVTGSVTNLVNVCEDARGGLFSPSGNKGNQYPLQVAWR